MGNRAIYHEGWMASTTPVNVQWNPPGKSKLPTDYKWELYDLRNDPAQTKNLAGKLPRKLAELLKVGIGCTPGSTITRSDCTLPNKDYLGPLGC